ncbi:MAG: DNA methyltransferase [Thermoplasmatota archaeon]
MREVSSACYKKFLEGHDQIVIEDRLGNKPVEIRLTGETTVKQYQPEDFELEATNVWSYPRRGTWATHKGNYRGNWPPQMVRNILLRYSEEGDLVLDQMVGSGTTLIECKLLGRNGIGVDINKNCVMLTRDRLNFRYTALDYDSVETAQETYVGDARNLDRVDDESIDLVATHPPYANIISYSNDRVEGDLSAVHSIDEFMDELRQVASEAYRVLKPGCYCAVLMGDTRRNKHHVPIAFRALQVFLEQGFVLKEDVMKHQWRCKATPFWLKRSKEYNFLLLKHEHLFILRKLGEDEDPGKFAESMQWW